MAIFSIFFTALFLPLALTFPSSSFNTQPKSSLSRPLKGRFLQITDIHPDPYYKRGTLPETSCHRRPHRSHKKTPKEDYSGYLGLPDSICDSPNSLVKATFEWIQKELKDQIDFVVWTGDNARHDTDSYKIPRTEEEIFDLNVQMVQNFGNIFGGLGVTNSSYPLTREDYILPIVPLIGNNDIYPHNILYGGPRNPILMSFQRIWDAFIPESQVHTFQEGGYYAIDVAYRLRILALNTMYFYNSNGAVDGCRKREEPGTGQIRWLRAELEKAESQDWKVIITGHIPPAKKSYSPSCHQRYASLGFRFKKTIVGHLFGHANLDHFFMISKDDTEKVPDDDDMQNDEAFWEPPDQLPLMVNHSSTSNSAETSLPHTNYSTLSAVNAYLETVLAQYEDLPSKGKCNNYFVVNVSPSVVPTYNPTLRVYEYELGENNFAMLQGYTQYWLNLTRWNKEAEDLERGEEEELDFVISEELQKEKKGGKKKPKKPEEPDDPNDPEEPDLPPLPPLEPPAYEVEYTTREDYGMEDLRSENWCHLGRRIGKGNSKLKRNYLQRVFVQTWDGELDKKYVY